MESLWEDSDISATTNPICMFSCWSFHSSQTSENIGYKVFETTNLKTLDCWWCCTWIRARYFSGLKKLLKLHVHLLNYCINFFWAVLLQQRTVTVSKAVILDLSPKDLRAFSPNWSKNIPLVVRNGNFAFYENSPFNLITFFVLVAFLHDIVTQMWREIL